jgi:hypothetical protein
MWCELELIQKNNFTFIIWIHIFNVCHIHILINKIICKEKCVCNTPDFDVPRVCLCEEKCVCVNYSGLQRVSCV